MDQERGYADALAIAAGRTRYAWADALAMAGNRWQSLAILAHEPLVALSIGPLESRRAAGYHCWADKRRRTAALAGEGSCPRTSLGRPEPMYVDKAPGHVLLPTSGACGGRPRCSGSYLSAPASSLNGCARHGSHTPHP